jgi:hypothetical protein
VSSIIIKKYLQLRKSYGINLKDKKIKPQEVSMEKENTVNIHITGVSKKTHTDIKIAAVTRGITLNELLVKCLESGRKRLKIGIEEKTNVKSSS